MKRSMSEIKNDISQYRKQIMGVAALWIWFFHMWRCVLSSIPILGFLEYGVKRMGFTGVDMFLFLSGMGLVNSITKNGVKQFYVNRCRRTLFPFLLVAMLRAMLEHWNISYFFLAISGLTLFLDTQKMFLWFVPAIMILYALFPFYYKLIEKIGVIQATLLSLIAWLLISVFFTNGLPKNLHGFIGRIPVFLIGVFAGASEDSDKKLNLLAVVLVLCSGLIVSFIGLFYEITIINETITLCIETIVIGVTVPILLAECFKRINSKICAKYAVLSFVGTISLEFYCVQEWFGNHVIRFWGGRSTMLLLNVVVLISTLILSYGVFRLRNVAISFFK